MTLLFNTLGNTRIVESSQILTSSISCLPFFSPRVKTNSRPLEEPWAGSGSGRESPFKAKQDPCAASTWKNNSRTSLKALAAFSHEK